MGYLNVIFRMIFIIIFSLMNTNMGLSGEIVRLANGEWPPFTSQKLKKFGVYSDIVSKAFALEGIEVEYKFFPWARSYYNVKTGTMDGSLTWAPTEEKKRDVIFSDPVFMHKKVIFHLKAFNFNWNSIKDLKGLNIGATRQYTYGSVFDNAAKRGVIHVEYTTNEVMSLKKLFAERVQVFLSDINVGYNLLRSNFTQDKVKLVTHHKKPIQETFTCVILTKKNISKSIHLMKLFNRGLRKLKKQGVYKKTIEDSRQGEYLLKLSK